MNSKVLIVGSPSEGLRQTLNGDFTAQNCETPTEALKVLAAEKPRALICCLPEEADALEFISKAYTLSAGMRVALIVPTGWSDAAAKLAESTPMLLLPAETRPALASANLGQFLSEANKRAEQRDFVEGTVRGC